LGVASVRAGNVIGGGDWSENRIIPDCIRSLKAQEPIILRNPASTRPWQHVLEPLFGYLALAAKLYAAPKQYSGSWNFGPRVDSIQSVETLATEVIKVWGEGELKANIEENAPHEARLLQLNCDKAYQCLGWSPCWDFTRTIEETVQWYHSVLDGHDALEMTQKQIHAYRRSQSHD
jgi:CDP-glucose 4,6-dehydratase